MGDTLTVCDLTSDADEGKAICDQSEDEFYEMLDALDEIRHRNPPTPIIENMP